MAPVGQTEYIRDNCGKAPESNGFALDDGNGIKGAKLAAFAAPITLLPSISAQSS